MKENIVRCVSWAAVSSKAQASEDKDSLPTQRENNIAFMADFPARYGCEAVLVAELQVVGTRSIILLSDAIAAYPEAYGVLARMIEEKSFDAILCRTRSRLGRETALLVTIESLCERAGILVIPLDAPPRSLDYGRDAGGRIVALFQSHTANEELRSLSRLRAMGMAARVRRGELFPGRVPFGYKYIYGEKGEPSVVVDPAPAEVVRAIFSLYLDKGCGANRIAEEMNKLGHAPPDAAQWSRAAVSCILNNAERYAGYVEYGRGTAGHVVQKARYAPLLTEEALSAVVSERAARSHRPLHPDDGCYTGVVFCAACGSRMQQRTRSIGMRDGSTQRYIHYNCVSDDCTARPRTVSDEDIEAGLRLAIREVQKEVDVDAIIESLTSGTASEEGRVAEAEQLLLQANRRWAKVREAFYADRISEQEFADDSVSSRKEIERCEARLANAKAALLDGRDRADIRGRVEEIRAAGEALLDRIGDSPAEVRGWLRRHFRVYAKYGEVVEIVVL